MTAAGRHLQDLTALVGANLDDQHDWTQTKLHAATNPEAATGRRPVLSGLPPRRLYIHPDEQIEALQAEHASGQQVNQEPEFEWVVPVHINEKLSLRDFATIFDSLQVIPPGAHSISPAVTRIGGKDWRGSGRQKRFLLAVVHDDSTVSYYLMHDGIVKPRQN